jgi:trimeric autotransporter adhesin
MNAVRSYCWTTVATVLFGTVAVAQTGPQFGLIDGPARQTLPIQLLQSVGSERLPDTRALPPAAKAQISNTVGEHEPIYHAVPQPRGFRLDNPTHTVSATFTEDGVDFVHGSHHWGITLRRYGYGTALQDAAAARPQASGNRVEYRRGELTEWYLNGPLGVEQGLTLDRAPARPTGEPLTLTFDLSGNLDASVDSSTRGLTLKDGDAAALRYAGLVAIDAAARELPAWLEVTGRQLRVRVDDRDARYPLTIDPYVQAVKLTSAIPCYFGGVCDDGAAYNEFGRAVGLSADGNTLVVGVPNANAAYVFVKPHNQLGGWNSPTPIYYVTKLVPSDFGLTFGGTTAITSDGSTIVIGARGYSGVHGAAYVYVRPANGWGGVPVRTQTAKLTPSDPSSFPTDGSFGNSLTISGDGLVIVAGAPDQEPTWQQPDKGAAYIYFRPWNGWSNMTQSQKFAGQVNNAFGSSVALSGDGKTLVIGAVEENLYGQEFEGAVSVYARREPEFPLFQYSFYYVAKLRAANPWWFDYFGYAASVNEDGSVIVVGAPGSDTPNVNQGAAYVFERWAANYWLQSAKLFSSDNQAYSLGQSVSVSRDGNTIVAGDSQASFLGESGAGGPGAAYLFWRPFSGWTTSTETARVTSSDGVLGDRFGISVSVNANGTIWAAGAPRATIGTKIKQGAAYVFTGQAPTPTADVSPSSLAFDPQAIGSVSPPQAVTISNTGTAPLIVTSVATTGPFVVTQNCTSNPIPAGNSCVENVMFSSLALGAFTGTLTITDNHGGVAGSTQQVQLAGTARKANTTIAITSVSPNPVLPGKPVKVHYAVTPEPGNLFFIPSGTVTVAASTGESCTGVAPSGSCLISFAGAVDRTITATYEGDANFAASTSQSALVRVVDFKVTVSPSTQTIVAEDTPFALYTVTVYGVNGFTGAVALGCAGGPAGTTCSAAPSTVTVSGASASASVRLTLPRNAAAGVYTVSVKGVSSAVGRAASATLIVR